MRVMGSDESRCRRFLKVLSNFWSDRSLVRSPDLPPMPPVALAPFRRNGMSGPVRGIGRHVRTRAVIVCFCRSGKDISYLLQLSPKSGVFRHPRSGIPSPPHGMARAWSMAWRAPYMDLGVLMDSFRVYMHAACVLFMLACN